VDTGKEVAFPEVWNKCALVAGWSVRSKHMERYCKQAFLRCIVSSRLIQAGSLQAGTEDVVAQIVGVGSIAKNRLTPQHFHGLGDEPLTPDRPQSTKTQLWVAQLGTLVERVLEEERDDLDAGVLVAAKRQVLCGVYAHLAPPDLPDQNTRGQSECAVKEWAVGRFEANEDTSWLPTYLSGKVRLIVGELARAYEFDEERSTRMKRAAAKKRRPSAKRHSSHSSSGEPVKSHHKRAKAERVPWTEEETAALCQGVIKFGTGWTQISAAATLANRAAPTCKDRMRTLVKQAGGGEYVKVAQSWLEGSGRRTRTHPGFPPFCREK
jgi:hypothetical protein